MNTKIFVHPKQYLVVGFKPKGKHKHIEQKKQETRDMCRHVTSYCRRLQKHGAVKTPCNTTVAWSVEAKRTGQDLLLCIFILLQYSLLFRLPGIYHRLHLGKMKRVSLEPVSFPVFPRTNLPFLCRFCIHYNINPAANHKGGASPD